MSWTPSPKQQENKHEQTDRGAEDGAGSVGERMKNNATMEDHWSNNPRFKEALAEQPAQTATYTCGVCGVSMHMEQPAQPSKTWAGLTDEEFAAMWMRSNIYGTNREKAIALGRAIEAKLREKNA